MHSNTHKPIRVGYNEGPVTKAPNWHSLVAYDILFNNLATGLFLVTAMGELLSSAVFSDVRKIAYPLALGFLSIDLVLLVLDLGDLWRFHHMLRVFKPSSPMSLGTWCLTAFSLPLTVLAVMSVLGIEQLWVHRIAVVAGIVPAFGSAVYKGVLFSTTSQPVWKDARWLGAYLTTSAILLGAIQLLVISIVTSHEQAIKILRPPLEIVIVVNSILQHLLLADVRRGLERIYPKLMRGYVALVAVGVAAPLILLIWNGTATDVMAVTLIVLAAVFVRFELVLAPHRPQTVLAPNSSNHGP